MKGKQIALFVLVGGVVCLTLTALYTYGLYNYGGGINGSTFRTFSLAIAAYFLGATAEIEFRKRVRNKEEKRNDHDKGLP